MREKRADCRIGNLKSSENSTQFSRLLCFCCFAENNFIFEFLLRAKRDSNSKTRLQAATRERLFVFARRLLAASTIARKRASFGALTANIELCLLSAKRIPNRLEKLKSSSLLLCFGRCFRSANSENLPAKVCCSSLAARLCRWCASCACSRLASLVASCGQLLASRFVKDICLDFDVAPSTCCLRPDDRASQQSAPIAAPIRSAQQIAPEAGLLRFLVIARRLSAAEVALLLACNEALQQTSLAEFFCSVFDLFSFRRFFSCKSRFVIARKSGNKSRFLFACFLFSCRAPQKHKTLTSQFFANKCSRNKA